MCDMSHIAPILQHDDACIFFVAKCLITTITYFQKPSKPPFFTKKIQPCRAFEQSQARFEVEFDGEPLPTVKWFREDFPIQSSPDLQIHTFGTKSILIVRQVFMEDSGVFSVVAENRGGSAKCSANLVVEERRKHGRGGVIPPSFLTTVQDTNIAVGQLARFDARVTGTKPLDVYWLKVRTINVCLSTINVCLSCRDINTVSKCSYIVECS